MIELCDGISVAGAEPAAGVVVGAGLPASVAVVVRMSSPCVCLVR